MKKFQETLVKKLLKVRENNKYEPRRDKKINQGRG